MEIEKAIRTAIEFEKKVEAVYRRAAGQATDEVGRKVFSALAEEETGHVAYLEYRLKQLERSGKITAEPLETVVPAPEEISAGLANLGERQEARDFGVELDLLKQALDAENETSAFYERMVETMDAEAKAMFEHFVEIEQGHAAIVQAEIDALTGMGFWFDFAEFNLEAG